MAEIFVKDLTLTYPLLGSGVRKKIINPWASGAGSVERGKDDKSRGVLALKDVSFHLKKGDRLGIVGPNGAGKSTLLRVLAGIYEPSVGEVRVEGEIATLFNIGLGLQAEATGYRNILLSGLISGKTRKEIVAKLPEIEEFSELGEYLKLPVRTYSNGMAMRLKFAAGTTFEPNILLMDEWLGAGDKKFTQKARARMQDIVSSAGILVLASHRQRLIQNECNKLLWLESGEVKAFGEVDDILPDFLESMEPEGQKSTHMIPKVRKVAKPPKPKDIAEPVVVPVPVSSMPLAVSPAAASPEPAPKKTAPKKKATPKKKNTPDKESAPNKNSASGRKGATQKIGRKKKAGGKKKTSAAPAIGKKPSSGGKKKGGKAKADVRAKSPQAKTPGRKKRAGGKKKAPAAAVSKKSAKPASAAKPAKTRKPRVKKAGTRK